VGDAGDALVLSGRGFGHGVGLCQEGAMERAKKGASPWAILDTYYQEIWLRHLSQITAPRAPDVSSK
jgi:stage II sporulation protein D